MYILILKTTLTMYYTKKQKQAELNRIIIKIYSNMSILIFFKGETK